MLIGILFIVFFFSALKSGDSIDVAIATGLGAWWVLSRYNEHRLKRIESVILKEKEEREKIKKGNTQPQFNEDRLVEFLRAKAKGPGGEVYHAAFVQIMLERQRRKNRNDFDNVRKEPTFKAGPSTATKAALTLLGLKAVPASEKELTSAWHNALKRAHPDVEGGSTERAQAVNVAYQTLKRNF